MSELSKAGGAGEKFRIGNVEFLIAPLTIGELSQLQRHFETEAIRRVEESTRHLDSEERASIIAKTASYNPNFSPADMLEAIGTVDGMIYTFWLMAKREQADITVEQIAAQINATNMPEYLALMEKLIGLSGESAPVPFEDETAEK